MAYHKVNANSNENVEPQALSQQKEEVNSSLLPNVELRNFSKPGRGAGNLAPIGAPGHSITGLPSAVAEHPMIQLQQRYGNLYVQCMAHQAKSEEDRGEVSPEVEAAIQSKRGGGQALDSGLRARMESSFGADFSGVRLHTGSEADLLNRSLSARAFTSGQDIFFRQGTYNPDHSDSRELLAHELTHVVQQGGKTRPKLTVGRSGDVYEKEADQVARLIMQQEQQPSQGDGEQRPVFRQVESEGEDAVRTRTEKALIHRQPEEPEEGEE